ncbi:TolC family protein [Pedobacter sp. WC2501]|uniref:TolC family protein n=1 Tax=Pedobacter sp. WC2501 TaxID=3461400 RepID=UPI0040459E1C
MKHKIKTVLTILVVLLCANRASAQSTTGYSLQQLIDSARTNNLLLSIGEFQVQEKMSKLKEDKIKQYPSVVLDGNFQYNFKLPDITIPAGSIGTVTAGNGTIQPMPAQDTRLKIGDKGSYNAGISLYQPIIQQARIHTSLEIDKTEINLSQQEKARTNLQLNLSVEQLYYGTLIAQKQAEAAKARLELTKSRIYDAQNALQAGKTTGMPLSGLQADLAGQEQNILKQEIAVQDYLAELIRLTNIPAHTIRLIEPSSNNFQTGDINGYKMKAAGNPEIQISKLNIDKARLGIKMARQGNLPDLGLIAGYYNQQGNPVLPSSSPYLGIALKWNLQDLFSNKQVQIQRQFQLKQAEANLTYTKQKVDTDIEKAWRKTQQSEALIKSAQKVVFYRKTALKEQEDKQLAGLDIKTSIIEARQLLAEAEADLYAAQFSNAMAISELANLTGTEK